MKPHDPHSTACTSQDQAPAYIVPGDHHWAVRGLGVLVPYALIFPAASVLSGESVVAEATLQIVVAPALNAGASPVIAGLMGLVAWTAYLFPWSLGTWIASVSFVALWAAGGWWLDALGRMV